MASLTRGLLIWLCCFFPFVSAPLAARPAPDSFADLAARLSPAVVNISTSQLPPAAAPIPGVPEDSPLNNFLEEFMGPQATQPQRRMQSLGSGFVIDPDGTIITNNHVIEGADRIEVTFTNGQALPAKLIGADAKTDLAVLRVEVEGERKFDHVELGDSRTARVGDWVVAIGNPFGLGGTVTAGIVSALNRDIHTGNYDDFIQTDAAINRGNSGGPLFDINGQVIGVNSAIISPSGASVGIGFAVPTTTIKPVMEQLLAHGEVRRGWLGLRLQSVTPEIAESLDLGRSRGALVAGIMEESPAVAAGIEIGDIVLAFDGNTINAMRDLPRLVASTEIGKKVEMQLFRDGETLTRQIEVARLEEEKPEPVVPVEPPKPAEIKTIVSGLVLDVLTPDLRSQYELGDDVVGVLISEVSPFSNAAEKGISAGEVIVEVARKPVTTPADVLRIVEAERKAGKSSLLLRLSLGGETRFEALRLDE